MLLPLKLVEVLVLHTGHGHNDSFFLFAKDDFNFFHASDVTYGFKISITTISFSKEDGRLFASIDRSVTPTCLELEISSGSSLYQ
jgi:hypothetical protein